MSFQYGLCSHAFSQRVSCLPSCWPSVELSQKHMKAMKSSWLKSCLNLRTDNIRCNKLYQHFLISLFVRLHCQQLQLQLVFQLFTSFQCEQEVSRLAHMDTSICLLASCLSSCCSTLTAHHPTCDACWVVSSSDTDSQGVHRVDSTLRLSPSV